jgi:hypothetical protein
MNLQVSGLPAFVVQVGFIVVFSAPVWLAARLVGAERPTLLRAIASLFLGVLGAVVGLVVGHGLGFLVFLIIPLAFLLSFKYVLGTSFLGSILLAVVALLGYAAMMHFLGGGLNLSGAPNGTTAV